LEEDAVTRLLNNDDVKQVLTMSMTMKALEDAYRQTWTGEATCRPRIDIEIATNHPEHTYRWGTMEGGSATSGYFAIRMKSDIVYRTEYAGAQTEEKYCVRPGLFCGLVMLFRVENAEPLAIINEGYLQHFRVGADAGIGARYMAREDARVVGMLGSGGMARSHLEALMQARRIERLQVYSPTPAHREAYAREMAEKYGIEAVALDTPRAVFRGADVVCGCTDTRRPVIMGEWLEPGTHAVDVGSGLDADAYQRVDVALRMGTAPAPLGLPEWQVEDPYVAYIARRPDTEISRSMSRERARGRRFGDKTVFLEDVLSGRAPGRRSAQDVTYSERGNLQGAQFFAVAGAVYEAATAAGIGRELPTEWFLQDIRD